LHSNSLQIHLTKQNLIVSTFVAERITLVMKTTWKHYRFGIKQTKNINCYCRINTFNVRVSHRSTSKDRDDKPLTLTSASDSIFPRSEAATHVYVADSLISFSIRTFFPIGMFPSGVNSSAPSRHLTKGIGDPTATQVRFTDPPGITSTLSGGIEKCGGTRRTVQTTQRNVN